MINTDSGMKPPIVLIEDDDIDTDLIIDAMKKYEMFNPFFRVKDGVEALELFDTLFKNGFIKPCIVLLDINLPKMNGLQLLQKIRHLDNMRSSIVYVLTTSSRNKDLQQAYEHNVAGYILKDKTEQFFKHLSAFCIFNEFSETIS